MTVRPQPGAPLGPALGAGGLFAAWCAGGGDGPAAAAELGAALAAPPGGAVAPWFAATESADWAAELAADLADDADRALLAANLEALRAGRAQVVVTGQQPGFLGGPLYTLHKIATAVDLARRMTATGRPTVPVFWSGDDDDDLVEALAPVAWAPPGSLVRSEAQAAARQGRRERRIIGRLPAADGQDNALRWLAQVGVPPGDSQAPGLLWPAARQAGWTWARLQRRALLGAFAGTGLLVVSGDDPRLHRTAAPLYGRILGGLPPLADAVHRRGQELEAAGWHAQIGARAAARPLYVARTVDRRPLDGPPPADRGLLRPGVMLRSPVQDWLLRPRAVVVGPGEYAYLRQLTGVYAALDLPRSPLVPRLFAWLLPPAFDRTLLARQGAPVGPSDAVVQAGLDRWEQESAPALRRLLDGVAGLPPARVEAVTAGRLRRWRRGLDAALRGARAAQLRAERPTEPAWVFPDGERQERRLAWGAARALWGPELVPRLLEAAASHLEFGVRGDWREWEITVTRPEELP